MTAQKWAMWRSGAARATSASILVIALGACAIDDEERVDDLPTSEATDPLWISTSITKWNGFVPVCFVPGFTTAQQDTIRRNITDTWGRAANLQFNGWATCASPIPGGMVAVEINTGLGTGVLGSTDTLGFPGQAAHTTVSYASGSPSQKTIIHEFGHVLGFLHEHFDDGTCNQRTSGGDELGTGPDEPTSVMSQTRCNSSNTPSPWDIVGVQNAYGRRAAGSIVGMNAQCLDIPIPSSGAGQNLQVFDCHGQSNQQWRMAADASISSPGFSPSTVDVEGGGSASGTPVQVFTKNVPSSANQRWRFNSVEIRGIGNLCLDIPSGNIFAGQLIQTFTCNNGTNQKWNIEWVTGSTIRIHAAANSSFCIRAPAGSVSGTDLQLASCTTDSTESFSITALGELKNQGLCWDSEFGDVAARHMQLFGCKAAGIGKSNQQYFLHGNITSDVGKCLTTSTVDFRTHDPAEIFSCFSSADFLWDYYFNP